MRRTIGNMKSTKGKEKITVLTAYDYSAARIIDEAGVDIILVGDSLGNVVLGYESTKEVTMEDMLRHTGAVARGAKDCLIVADMPYNSDETMGLAVKNAKLLIKAGAHAVKIEGKPEIAEALVKENIIVMGHVGLLPQTAEEMKVQGKDEESAGNILNDAIALEKAGCFAIVLECVPEDLAKKITETVKIPTIGIGSGPYCDGQVLVSNDMLGLFDKTPKFVRKYANLKDEIKKAVEEYCKDVKEGNFPSDKECFK
ncbi:3-methyl-2-oxobutanoate hydroxymethyltransferase [Candidatus Woesearchaeota archaeon]|nr:3-methyl-2-oxobutanoate hydroxymethyltransferase [Candidatus Woesearchaeota archaeon]